MARFANQGRDLLFAQKLSIPAFSVRPTARRHIHAIYASHLPQKGRAERGGRTQCYEESAGYARQLHDSGKYISAAPLQPTATATSVRFQEGKRLITDGPFAETREQLGGYFLIEGRNLDEAIEIAGQIPAGRWGTVEIRPVVEVQGLPAV